MHAWSWIDRHRFSLDSKARTRCMDDHAWAPPLRGNLHGKPSEARVATGGRLHDRSYVVLASSSHGETDKAMHAGNDDWVRV
jgi:hypothetical protein